MIRYALRMLHDISGALPLAVSLSLSFSLSLSLSVFLDTHHALLQHSHSTTIDSTAVYGFSTSRHSTGSCSLQVKRGDLAAAEQNIHRLVALPTTAGCPERPS